MSENKYNSMCEDLLLYAKYKYVPYSKRDVVADLCVIMGHNTLMQPEYYLTQPKSVMHHLIAALFELRGGQVPEREIQDIMQARYNWLGENTIECILSFFSQEKMVVLDDDGNVVEVLRKLPTLNNTLQLKLVEERAKRNPDKGSLKEGIDVTELAA